jgi:polyphosphate glucokinase
MELSHGRFGEGLSIEVACGDHHREQIGTKAWRRLVMSALDALEAMVLPDRLYVGGGNAKRLDPASLGPGRSIVPNISGLLGGLRLWDRAVGAAGLGDVPAPAHS